jgi:hypothetical protein
MVDGVCNGYVHSVSNAHLGLKRNNTYKQFPITTRSKRGHKMVRYVSTVLRFRYRKSNCINVYNSRMKIQMYSIY